MSSLTAAGWQGVFLTVWRTVRESHCAPFSELRAPLNLIYTVCNIRCHNCSTFKTKAFFFAGRPVTETLLLIKRCVKFLWSPTHTCLISAPAVPHVTKGGSKSWSFTTSELSLDSTGCLCLLKLMYYVILMSVWLKRTNRSLHQFNGGSPLRVLGVWSSHFLSDRKHGFPMSPHFAGHIQASRALMIIALVLGLGAIIVSMLGLKCIHIGTSTDQAKGKLAGTGGILAMLGGEAPFFFFFLQSAVNSSIFNSV